MQEPTCVHMCVRSPSDAHVVFHAVSLGLRPMVSRRLDSDERRYIQSGCVFVWEERGPNAESSGIGIERWTDSIRWGPSRVRDEFLYYNERESTPSDQDSPVDSLAASSMRSHTRSQHRGNLIKQTYSVFVDTNRGRRKWHLIAYFTQDSISYLRTVDDFPDLASISVPPGKYKTARSGNRGAGRMSTQNFETFDIVSIYPRDRDPYEGLNHGFPHRQHLDHLPIPPASTASSHTHTGDMLAPLEYLKTIPPPRRHPLDEEALMSFGKKLTWVR